MYELETEPNPHTEPLGGQGVVRRKAGQLSDPPDHQLRLSYAVLDLSKVWINYPAYAAAIRHRISLLRPGTAVRLEMREDENRIFIRDSEGRKVGALSASATEEWKGKLQVIKEVKVHAIVHWKKDLLDQEPLENSPDEWEIPLLEVVSFDGAQHE